MSLILGALALCLLMEGMIPLLWPDFFRRRLAQMGEMTAGQLRFVGLVMSAAGLLLGALALAD